MMKLVPNWNSLDEDNGFKGDHASNDPKEKIIFILDHLEAYDELNINSNEQQEENDYEDKTLSNNFNSHYLKVLPMK